MIDDIIPGPGSGINTYGFGSYYYGNSTLKNNGLIYFAANDGTHGSEPWVTDGTQQGTQMLADINPGSGSSNPTPLAFVNGQLLLYADDGVHGSEPWTVSPSTGPAITPIPAQTVTVHQTLSLSVQATSNNDPTPHFVFALVNGPPVGATINSTSGAFSWLPTATGTFSITVQVTDTNQQGNPTATGTIQVTVNPAAPSQLVFTSPPLTLLAGSRGQVTLQLLDQYGNPGASPTSLQTILLSSTSPAGVFYASQSSTTPTNILSVGVGQSSVSFFYSDTQGGTPTVTASDGAVASPAPTQQETVSAAAASQVAITSPVLILTAGIRGQVTVALEDSVGNLATSTTAETIGLSTTSPGGTSTRH